MTWGSEEERALVTYTVEQGVAVAMFNAGVKEEGLLGIPTAKAKAVVAYLTQMGFDIDPTKHMAGHRRTPDEPLPQSTFMHADAACTRPGCGKPYSEHELGIFCP